MSRPEIPINWEKVDELLMCGCPGTEIAAFFGIHENTFYHRVEQKYGCGFSEYSAKKKATGQALLRLQQHQQALGLTKKGNTTMLIFLGKQRLGQRENPNDQVAPEEVLKAFDDLMKQLDNTRAEREQKKLEAQTSTISSSVNKASAFSSG